jgi:RecA-family ATPase
MEFQIVHWKDAVIEGTEDWVIDGILSADTTLLYGEPKLGKSYFVGAMLVSLTTGADTFLDKKITGTYRPAVCWTDDRGWREYKKRMLASDEVRAGNGLDLDFVALPMMRTADQWRELADKLLALHRNLVVIDNMSSAVYGSMNDDGAVRGFFAGVKTLTDAGMAVLVLAHASDAKDQYGRGGSRPQGHTLTSAAVRWRCFMQRSNGHSNVKLSFSGNVSDPHEMTVHGDGMTYGVLSTKDAAQLRTEKTERSRKRASETLDRGREIAEWVIRNHLHETNKRVVGQLIADQFGGSPETHRSNLSARRKEGAMLRIADNQWVMDLVQTTD